MATVAPGRARTENAEIAVDCGWFLSQSMKILPLRRALLIPAT